jgi:hypothetical protein
VQGGSELAVDYGCIFAKQKSNYAKDVKEALDELVLLCNNKDRMCKADQRSAIPHLIELLSAEDSASHQYEGLAVPEEGSWRFS